MTLIAATLGLVIQTLNKTEKVLTVQIFKQKQKKDKLTQSLKPVQK